MSFIPQPVNRILLVDDEPYNLMALKIVLSAACDKRYNLDPLIDVAKNGQEALRKAMSGKYSLIFMDCSMPIMDGYEASHKIRQYLDDNQMDQPMIVACTGHTEPDYIKKAWKNGMDEVISKPAKIENLRIIIQQIIKNE